MNPPTPVRSRFARGLALYRAGYGGRGLTPDTIRWAERLARGEPATREKLIAMRSWHARHYVDRRPGWSRPPTPGYVAYLLWGGTPGRIWADRLLRRIK